MCKTNVCLQWCTTHMDKNKRWLKLCALMGIHIHILHKHTHLLYSSGKLLGACVSLYGYGSHGIGYLWCPADWTKGELWWGLNEERSGVSLGFRPQSPIYSLLCVHIEPHSRWYMCWLHTHLRSWCFSSDSHRWMVELLQKKRLLMNSKRICENWFENNYSCSLSIVCSPSFLMM